MSGLERQPTVLAAKFEAILPHLDERQRRLLIGAEAQSLGHGGIRAVARAAGVREATVSVGVRELDSGEVPLGRIRRSGAGRKRVVDRNPAVREALLTLVEPDVRGDPMSPLRWTTKSTRKLAEQLTRQGHKICADTVGDLLREEGFSLQSNAKTLEGKQHPDRDAQFHYLNEQARDHQDCGAPVISVDTKKKELVGPFKNNGREWEPRGEPVRVDTHDFPDRELGRAVPYGIFDVAANTGWVNVGTDHDTAAFAVESIRRWWNGAGRAAYPTADRLLITADAGGSNGYRTRTWKTELARFATEAGLTVTVCHLPPGTSKWNRIEHRLFSHITMNWRGRPLTSHEVIVQSIAATTTKTGLTVHAELDTNLYPTGVQVSDDELAALPITRHRFHGDWNYTLHPQPSREATAINNTPDQAQANRLDHLTRRSLQDPELTGMTRQRLSELIDELTPALEAQREDVLRARRGHERLVAPGTGAKAKLTPADRVLATVLHLRKLATMDLLGQLFGVSAVTICRANQEIRPLLEAHGPRVDASTARFRTPADITTFLASDLL
ncbi:ISAzo13 family transposase [Streptomyces glycanivorans]|uniref:ISAzo13 family transposase n=1 Tax=Streptomyces glycanivorans TaxID=3033808 RepID=A0ABY9JAG6_9ACTN|nr:ISAzo13 family transposase [Streptomyces sp. Alt3]WLQ62171.1 ISAzo13 family transposase [Streptomyces sp. Alt3]WLQ63374.1 ISAzo13 family transposase [Streptomyces sp. Alt3]